MKIKEFLAEVFDGEDIKNYKPRHPRIWRFVKNFIVCYTATFFLMVGYIWIGHDKDWPRAERWYTCLMTHNHFPWQ